jgi:hypothetical protein
VTRRLAPAAVSCMIDGVVVDVLDLAEEQETITVPTLGSSVPDPTWRFVDGHQHVHAFDSDARTPTLREVPGAPYWCEDCRDDHTDTRLECLECREHITPVYRSTGPSVLHLPGPRTTRLGVLAPGLPVGRRLSVEVVSADGSLFGFMQVLEVRTSLGELPRYSLTG